ncbi:zf-HC2 domain-containing protein [Streptomyces sp. CA-294286]|uniref:zf-HC2 domain-containing protein n=1 Tax=Streptomyces sp. CA-294286 TaxID=3240070 RepID=UPI003D8C8F70
MKAAERRAWHVGEDLAARYANGSATEPDAWSLEKHVESCRTCAGRVSAAVRAGPSGGDLAAGRAALLAAVEAEGVPHTAQAPEATRVAPPVQAQVHAPLPRPQGNAPHPAGPLLDALPRPRPLFRLWAFGPAPRRSWLASVVLVAIGAVLLAYAGGMAVGPAARPLLLTLAPLVPLAGVAASYGRHADPMHEINASTPGGGLRLLLLRTAVVLGVSVPLLTVAGAVLPDAPGVPGAAAWLLPGLALTLTALVLGSWLGCRTAAAAVATGWALAVTLPAVSSWGADGDGPVGQLPVHIAPYLDSPGAQNGWAAAVVVCAGLLVVRRTSFDRLENS